MLYYPELVAIAGLLSYLALVLVAPLETVHPIPWAALAYIAVCYLAFLIGSISCKGFASRRPRAFAAVTGIWVMGFVGALGVALRAYEKLFIRGINVGSEAFEARELLSSEGPGHIAALGAVLYPLCYVPLILLWAIGGSRRDKLIAGALFVLPWLEAIAVLSRSLIITSSLMMYVAAACALYGGKFLPGRLVAIATAGVIALFSATAAMFYARLDEMQMDIVASIYTSVYGYTLAPADFVVEAMTTEGKLSGLLRASIPAVQYYLHGMFEFGLLFSRPDAQDFLYGAEHFAPFIKFLTLFGITPPDDWFPPYYRDGVLTSFFGPLWVDFGWVGAIVMWIFGMACEKVANAARCGDAAALPLHAYLCVVLFLMPVCNFLVSAQGMYVVTAFLLVWVFAGASTNRLRQRPSYRSGMDVVARIGVQKVRP